MAVAIGLLFLSFYKVNLRELWTSIAQLNFLYLFASFCSAVAMNWAKGMRWRALIREVKPVSKTRMFALFHVGQMINLSLPALTGQAGRIVMLSKAEGLSKTLCFTTVAMEVLFDGISLIVLVYLASFIFAFPVWLRQAEIYAAIGISVFLFIAFLVWRNKRALEYFRQNQNQATFSEILCQAAEVDGIDDQRDDIAQERAGHSGGQFLFDSGLAVPCAGGRGIDLWRLSLIYQRGQVWWSLLSIRFC